ncbi:MAG: Nif3-like dinuclear metal center hexameric protein [Ekhidna sp.]
MNIKEITTFLEQWAPTSLQESYDNSGLLLGEMNQSTKQALITLDITEEVIDEAIDSNSDFIIAHHPFIFSGIKKIGNSHWIDRCIRKAIKHDIAIYAIHTNLDNVHTGVNKKIADKIGLVNTKILRQKKGTLTKLTVFVPEENTESLANALYSAGAGEIGNYSHCRFESRGVGFFKPNNNASPHIGKAGLIEKVEESRIEVLVPKHMVNNVLSAMREEHPYEEVAYYLQDIINDNQEIGSGMIGDLTESMESITFLKYLKKNMDLSTIRHTRVSSDSIKKVAICGGSGSFLLNDAIQQKADIFITADFKYHDFFEANNEITIADIGHYESEVFTKELLHDVLTKNFTKFAFRLSKVDTNPINYL